MSAALTLVMDGEGHTFVAAPGYSRSDVANILRATAEWYEGQTHSGGEQPAAPDPLGIYPGDATDEDITAALRGLQLVPPSPETYRDTEYRDRIRLLSGWLAAAVEHRSRTAGDAVD